MQESAEICTLKNSHARQNNPTSLMISKRLVMVCVRQETSNTMFTTLSLCIVSVNVLTALLMCRTWLIRVYFSSVPRSFPNYVPLRHTTIKYRERKSVSLVTLVFYGDSFWYKMIRPNPPRNFNNFSCIQ